MKLSYLATLSLLSILTTGCYNPPGNDEKSVVTKRYIHALGFDVSQNEWESHAYPGRVVTTLRNGVIINASYDQEGLLNGPLTHTYPHSQTIESLSLYEKGHLTKKTFYNIRGIPEQEQVFLSPHHFKMIKWYQSGTPMSIEEYHQTQLLEGNYYNLNNELESRVSKGVGTKIKRDQNGQMTLKEEIDHGYPILKTTFYPHGIPHTITPLIGNQIEGEKKVFALTGEPLSHELYKNNQLNGLAVYFQNGCRYLEVPYKDGLKHGIERHYIDGETLAEETHWHEGHKHGASIVYFDGMSKTDWYYNNDHVSKEKYDQLCRQEENIAIMNERSKLVP